MYTMCEKWIIRALQGRESRAGMVLKFIRKKNLYFGHIRILNLIKVSIDVFLVIQNCSSDTLAASVSMPLTPSSAVSTSVPF